MLQESARLKLFPTNDRGINTGVTNCRQQRNKSTFTKLEIRENLHRPVVLNQPTTNHHNPPTMASKLESFSKWLQLKLYQFEVTLSVYMFTFGEKFFFCASPPSSFLASLFPPLLTLPNRRLDPLPALLPHFHRDCTLPPAAPPIHHQPRLVLHARRGLRDDGERAGEGRCERPAQLSWRDGGGDCWESEGALIGVEIG